MKTSSLSYPYSYFQKVHQTVNFRIPQKEDRAKRIETTDDPATTTLRIFPGEIPAAPIPIFTSDTCFQTSAFMGVA